MRFSPYIAAMGVALLFAALPSTSAARTHATAAPSPTPSPIADPAITKLARQQFVAWQAGVVNDRLYAAQVLDKLSPDKIADTSRALGQLGALTDTIFIGPWIDPSFPTGAHGYIYQMRCQSGNVYLLLALDSTGKIATVLFKSRLDVETVTPAPNPS
jgi:hypothetical protein